MLRYLCSSWLVLASLLLTSPLRAQQIPAEADDGGDGAAEGQAGPGGEEGEGEGEDPAATARRAREHFMRGMRHYEQRAYREAIQEFELAAQLVPSADLWFNIARAHEELSEYDRAAESYRRYLRDRVDPPDQEEIEAHASELEARAEAERRAARTRPTTGTLRVRSEEPGDEVVLDGEEIGETPIPLPLTVQGGAHDVEIRREGSVPFRARVTVSAGTTSAAQPVFTEQTRLHSAAGSRLFTWIVGGLSAAALVTSVGLGAHAISLNQDGDLGGALRWGAYSDYTLAAGLGLGLTAVILYFVEGSAGASAAESTSGTQGAEAIPLEARALVPLAF
ncbi:MAG: PEGA domain-containing protein [Myxococcales bacterium]|nr:PEGA domain-containing protein [Myxococcales bacterium]